MTEQKFTASQDVNVFAKTNFRNAWKLFGIKTDDRRRHMYIIGKTGMGKSTMIENMVFQDIAAGHGLALVDPHGDAAEKMLDYIPSYRVNDVVYFNPSDVDFPIGFNVLESVDVTHRHLVASGLIAVFKKIWVDSWGPRLEYVLRNTILSLLEYPGSTLLGVTRMLVDKKYRDKVLEKVSDPVVKAFWLDEFNAYSNQFRTEAVSPIQNKVGQFLSSSVIRNIVGQPKSTLDMRKMMDEGKILILNLAKGRIGEDNSALLGAMLITKLQLAAMSRIDIPEESRKDFFLYVDEFQNFATESFANILSEARKYHLNLIVAHQYIEQLDEKVSAAVFGNVGSIVCFRVGATDAEVLVKEFEPTFAETDLVNLTKYDIYLKLMIDGVASDPFSATTLPPVYQRQNLGETIIRVSRERYSQPRDQVEEKIMRWHGLDSEGMAQREGAAGPPRGESRIPRRDDRRPPPPEALQRVDSIPTEPSISLAEALQRKPQGFTRPADDGKGERPRQPRREERPSRPDSRPARPRPDSGPRRPMPKAQGPRPAVVQNPPVRTAPTQDPPRPAVTPQVLHPGERAHPNSPR